MNKVTYNLKDGRQFIVPYNRLGVAPISKQALESLIEELDRKYEEEKQFIKCLDASTKAFHAIERATREQALDAYKELEEELEVLKNLISEEIGAQEK